MSTAPLSPSQAQIFATGLSARLKALCVENDVPGAALAVLHMGQLTQAVHGVLNRSTRVRVTTDSVFQIGSVTKVFTATLVMQLVDEGLLDLDTPVVSYLPDFRTQDPSLSQLITPRHLLLHTAGFEGDLFVDTGAGTEALARLMPAIAEAVQFSRPGVLYSYSNAGYCVLGRLVEVLHDTTFDEALRSRIAQPLGLRRFACDAEEAILFRAAAGHLRPAAGVKPEVVDQWSLVRSGAPAGTRLSMSAADLVRFSTVHLGSGSQPPAAVLSQESVALMQQPHLDVAALLQPLVARGFGWGVYPATNGPVIGHAGATLGQYAFLRLVPGQDLAVALLTNGGEAGAVALPLMAEVLHELAAVSVHDATPAPAPRASTRTVSQRCLGSYAASLFTIEISTDYEGRVWAERHPGPVARSVGDLGERYELYPVDDDRFVRLSPQGQSSDPHVFLGNDSQGRAELLHTGRVLRRLVD
jgi:CubicO group peptidase (beta-lactamase class C family)